MPTDGAPPKYQKTALTAAESGKSKTGRVVLITGTAGFVGFHCALALKKRGDGVLGLDNFNAYYPVGIKYDRAEALERAGVYSFKADLNDRSFVDHILKEYGVTHVLALAAQAGVRYATKDPASYVSSNISGFVNLLEACRFCHWAVQRHPFALLLLRLQAWNGCNVRHLTCVRLDLQKGHPVSSGLNSLGEHQGTTSKHQVKPFQITSPFASESAAVGDLEFTACSLK